MKAGKRYLVIGLLVLLICITVSCAPGNERWDQTMYPGHRAGFWAGIWHGFIIIVTFIISLFDKTVGIYEVNNTGWPYNLGFLIGLCFSILAPWRAKSFGKRKKKCKED